MKKSILFPIVAIVFMCMLVGPAWSGNVIDDSKKPQFLFVLSAESGTYEDDKLTLKGVPLVVYFSDRPHRIAGHMTVEKLVKLWSKGMDSFKADPPNATLSIFDGSGNKSAVVEISNPVLMKETISFNLIKILGPKFCMVQFRQVSRQDHCL